MGSGMNTEQAKEHAKTMTYKQAVSNCFHAKGIMYRKATMIKLRELAEIADRLDRKTEPLDKDINVRSKDCETCGTPRRWCYYCIEEDRMWTPKTEPQTKCYLRTSCDHYEDKQVCGRCREYNLYSHTKDEPQTERLEQFRVGLEQTEPQIRCPKCGRTDYIRSFEKDFGIKDGSYKYKCINCNTYIKDEPQTNTDQHIQHVESVETMSCQECKHWIFTSQWGWFCPLKGQDECHYEPIEDEPQTDCGWK